MRVKFHVYVSRITALTCRPVKQCKILLNMEEKSSKTPVKVITPDDHELCRVCRCSPAILGRGKFNLFNAQSKGEGPRRPLLFSHLGKTGLAKIIAHLTNSSLLRNVSSTDQSDSQGQIFTLEK